ncbi:MAG TPA: DUF2242 domain-containing protein [Noviherbaspirillum sp.]|jgi:hypothetical protein|uniref:DUF2242 domain-containing protein n=1 Tax=Noviherbaspirillum sp. TaxID=1926288 RepID=UPI002F93A6C9
MRKTTTAASLLSVLFTVLALAACSLPSRQARFSEDFAASDVHARGFGGSDKATCEAARRALLSQGYVISEASASLVRGRKNFQPERDQHLQVEFHVVCAPNSPGSNSSTAFANAVRDSYSLKKSSTSASLGVGALGSLSLPLGMSDDALVKVGSETIDTPRFYEQFFGLMERYFDGAGDPGEETAEGSTRPDAGAAAAAGR